MNTQHRVEEDRQTLEALWHVDAKITLAEAERRLHEVHPAWRLDPAGLIVAANLLMLWLWEGASAERKELATKRVLGLNVFDILADNLFRLPPGRDSEELLKKKSAVAWAIEELFGEGPIRSFRAAMRADKQRRDIYERARGGDLEHAWQYKLTIAPPGAAPNSHDLLMFQASISEISEGEEVLGYLAEYQPLGTTGQQVKDVYRALIDIYGDKEYIQRCRGGKHAIKEHSSEQYSQEAAIQERGKREGSEAIALQFSIDDTPQGWGTLNAAGVPSMYVVETEKGHLAYIFSSRHWKQVQEALEFTNIPYQYKRATGFSKKRLIEPSWQNSDVTK